MKTRSIGSVCRTVSAALVACAVCGVALAVDPVVIDYAYVSSYDPVVFGNYCVTSLPSILSIHGIDTTTSGVKQASAKWSVAIDVPSQNGTQSRKLVSGSAKWKDQGAGVSLSLQQDITAKLLKKLIRHDILTGLAAGEMHGNLSVSFKGKMADNTAFLAQTSVPVTFNLDRHSTPGTASVTKTIGPEGGSLTSLLGAVVINVPADAAQSGTTLDIFQTTNEFGDIAFMLQSDKIINGDVFVSIASQLCETVAGTKVKVLPQSPSVVAAWHSMWVYMIPSAHSPFITTTFRSGYEQMTIALENKLDILVYPSIGSRLVRYGSGASPSGKKPVLLIHGFSPDIAGNWNAGGERGIGGGPGTWADLPELLGNRFGDSVVVYEFQWNTNARFQDAAGDLKKAVVAVYGETGQKIHIVAHSFGGLLARTFLQGLALDKNGMALTDYDEARNNIASLVTVGTPHSGIRDAAGTMHGVPCPGGQDAIAFEGAEQIAVHQAGEHVGFVDQFSSLIHCEAEPGELIALLNNESYPLPSQLQVYVLIGMTTGRHYGGNIFDVDAGDGLFTFEGQRFLPFLTQDSNVLNQATAYLGGVVTEQILGSPLGVTTKPRDAGWAVPDKYGYRHNGKVSGPGARAEVCVEAGTHADHATYLDIVSWLMQFVGGDASGDYCIVDVAGGPNASFYPVSYQSTAPALNDTHKITKIVLRKMPAGSFTMGSPSGEMSRCSDESQHYVTLTKAFYMGIYEITQAQYSNVMGANPSYFPQGAHAPMRPLENVAWTVVRGGTWPGGTPGSTTFMGTLRRKTGLAFDLPTEAQWEYACRAGTTKALNNNTDLTSTTQDATMDMLGRYRCNGGSISDPVNGMHAAVGAYLVNQWGLYDMHGNVWEWCLDWYGAYEDPATDPRGAAAGSNRVIRGGGWDTYAYGCRSAGRYCDYPGGPDINIGFRVSLATGR